jgi:hypothetical protein
VAGGSWLSCTAGHRQAQAAGGKDKKNSSTVTQQDAQKLALDQAPAGRLHQVQAAPHARLPRQQDS